MTNTNGNSTVTAVSNREPAAGSYTMPEPDWPIEAFNAATSATWTNKDGETCVAADHLIGYDVLEVALRAAMPWILAAELDRLTAGIDTVADPAGDAWLKAEAAGRREVVAALRQHASELRGGAS